MYDLFFLLSFLVVLSPIYIIMEIVENYKKEESEIYTVEYYLQTYDNGEEYLVPYNLSPDGIKSPRETKIMLETQEHEILYGLGDIPVVQFFYEKDSGKMTIKELILSSLPFYLILYSIYAVLLICVIKGIITP